MKRHRNDFVALVAGLLFLGIGAVYMTAAYSDFDVDSRWIGPAALIGIGVAGLAATVATGRSDRNASKESRDVTAEEHEQPQT